MCRLMVAFWIILGLVAGGHASDKQGGPVRRIAFGSCVHQGKPQPVWDAINALRPEVFLLLGDNIYADTDDMGVMKQKYDQQAAVPGFRQLRSYTRLLATWDDHDYGRDDVGVEYAKKTESQKLFLDYLGVPADSPRRSQPGIYHAEVFGPPGQRVQVILLDTRFFRSPLKKHPSGKSGHYLPDDSSEATFLGEAQWKWLEAQFQQPAEIRLIGSSIQVVAQDHVYEKWANFPRQRDRLLGLLEKTNARGVIFLSGDRHLAEISMLAGALSYPLYDITSSGLSEGNKRWRPQEDNRHRVGSMNFGNNFGFLTIDWYQDDPILRLQIRDEEGEVTLQQKLRLSVIHPNHQAVAAAGTPKNPLDSPPPPITAPPVTAPPVTTTDPTPAPSSPKGDAITPDEAAKKVGETVTLEMYVKRSGASGNRVFLNSLDDFRDKKNFTIVLEKTYQDKAREVKDPRNYFWKKTVRVTGKVELFRDAPQIKVTDPKQIKVIEK
jgi:alkaline phosphatase D